MARKPAPEPEAKTDVKTDGGVAEAVLPGAPMADPAQTEAVVVAPVPQVEPMADPAQTDGSLPAALAGTQGADLAGAPSTAPADPLQEFIDTLKVSAVVTDRLDHDGVTYLPGELVSLPIAVAEQLYRMGVVDPID